MPSRCCVPLCKGNYNTGPTVSVYSFPKADGLKKAWLAAIQRKDFNPTTSSKVRILLKLNILFRNMVNN